MIEPGFSYRHLHYFWVVANEGGVARGAARLGVAVQTVSAQLHLLERSLGLALFKPAGRTLALTDAGQAVWRQADQIFQLGAALPALAAAAAGGAEVRLAVGVSDGLAKLVVHRLLSPVIDTPRLRLLCPEGALDTLLAELALHRLDLVLADRPAPPNPNLRLYSHPLATSGVAWYGLPSLALAGGAFPARLGRLPVLLPTAHSALRQRLDRWFERHELRPRVAGEFEDSALMKTFAAAGMGVFPGPVLADAALRARYGVEPLGRCDGVEEHIYAIGTEKKVQHPLVQRLLAAAPGAAEPGDASHP
jgi:LysR family transcriptional regulator, transcriptional activator of nhaA